MFEDDATSLSVGLHCAKCDDDEASHVASQPWYEFSSSAVGVKVPLDQYHDHWMRSLRKSYQNQ